MRNFLLVFIGILFALRAYSQINPEYSFKLEKDLVDSKLNVTADFSFYGHQYIYDAKDLAKDLNFRFYINNQLYREYQLYPSPETDSVQVLFIYDHFEKNDCSKLMEIIPNILQTEPSSYIKRSGKHAVMLSDSLQFVSFSQLSHLSKRDSFSLHADYKEPEQFFALNKSLNPNTVILYVSGSYSSTKIQSIRNIVASNSSGLKPLIALLNVGQIPLSVREVKEIMGDFPFVVKNTSLYDEYADFNIASLVDAWRQKSYRLNFQLPDISVDQILDIPNFTYSIDFLTNDQEYIQYPLPIFISTEQVLPIYEHAKVQYVDSLIHNNHYELAMEELLLANEIYQSPKFQELAEQDIINYGNYLMNNPMDDCYNSFLTFEQKWNKDFSKEYNEKRLNLFHLFYAGYPKNKKEFIGQRLKLSNKIYMNEKNCLNKINLLVDSANMAMSEGNRHWDALSLFKEANSEISSCTKNKEKAAFSSHEIDSIGRGLILTAIRNDYSEKKYRNIANYAEDYDSWFMKDYEFEEKYKIAESYRQCSRYSPAMKKYEQLISNWEEDQDLILWYDAFNILQEMYLKNARYEDAIEMNQQIYRAETDNDDKKNVALEISLATLRAKYLKPVVDIMPYVMNNNSTADLKEKFNFKVIQVPSWLTAICTLNENKDSVNTFYASDKFGLETKYKSAVNGRTTIFLDTKDDIYWMVVRIASTGKERFVAFQISNKIRTQEERTMLDEISRSKMDERLWLNLFKEVEKEGVKYSSQFIAALLETQISANNIKDVATQINKLIKQNDCLDYFRLHEAKSEDTEKLPVKSNSYKSGEYERSAKAGAYYEQLIQDGAQKYYDVCNPVYSKAGWIGVLRLGYLTYYR